MLLNAYFFIGAGWAVGAAFQQLKQSSNKLLLIGGVMLNCLFWPVSMVAAYMKESHYFVIK